MSVVTVSCRGRYPGEERIRYMISCYHEVTFAPGQSQLTPSDALSDTLAALSKDGHEIIDLDDAAQAEAFVARRNEAYAARWTR